MLFRGRRDIDVQEYDRNSIITPGTHGRLTGGVSQLPFNGWSLAQAMAMTTASQHLNNREFWLDIMSSLFGLHNTIHSDQMNARVKSSRMDRLRDFSKTSRIGEMSQGITYLQLQHSGYPFINDFHTYCDANGIQINGNSSTPDFVGQDQQLSNRICLAESKGKLINSNGSIKSKLAEALVQCNNGEAILNGSAIQVHKKLGYCTEWSDENSIINSTLHFVDPVLELERIESSSIGMSLHFAAWMYMAGEFKNVDNLMEEGGIDWNPRNFEPEEINGQKYWMLTRFPEPIENLIKESNVIYRMLIDRTQMRNRIGISDQVIRLLENRSEKSFQDFDFNNRMSEGVNHFIDGTIIQYK